MGDGGLSTNLALVLGDCYAAFGGFIAALPHLFVRFLPTQEWSTCVRGIAGRFCRYLHARHCEIPAFVGMICLGTGDCCEFEFDIGDNWARLPLCDIPVLCRNGPREEWRIVEIFGCCVGDCFIGDSAADFFVTAICRFFAECIQKNYGFGA